MAFTYDPSTTAGRVRLLIPDTNSTNPVFDDDEITAFLAIEGDNTKRAAAMGKEVIAGDQVMVLKVIRNMDLSTDGAAVGRELRQQAKALRDQADVEEANDEGGAFDIAEWVVDGFTEEERVWKQIQRLG